MVTYARRIALFILKDQRGRFLLQHKDETSKRIPNYWGFFGGGIKKGETPEQAVIREAHEELKIGLEQLKFFKKYIHKESIGIVEKNIFTAQTAIQLEKLREQQTEGDDIGFFSLEETKALRMLDNDRAILADISKR